MAAVGLFSASLSYVQKLLDSSLPDPPLPEVETYDKLQCDEDNNITTLITTMGESSYPALFWNQRTLIDIGKAITPVHPLKFLSVILTNRVLIHHVKSFQDSWKWSIFCLRLNHNLSFLHQHDKVKMYLDGFIADVFKKKPEEEQQDLLHTLEEFTDKQQWEQMVSFLLDYCDQR